ncbi:MAG: S41 family peptidase [Alphaproteobacteria bacterium]|nr:S41 family peptidase [Alphaproteobacteria bacterium]
MENSLKKSFLFLSSLFVVLLCNTSCSGGSIKKDNEEAKFQSTESAEQSKAKHKCDLIIPDTIKKNIPEDMQYIVFLQMILGMVRSEYVNELTEGETIEKSISGMLSSLDPHSSYLNEKAFSALKNQTDGEFGGLGIEIMMDESFVRIISPIDDTPAYKAGLKSGDMIIYVNDECVNGLSAEETLERLRGKPGTKVKLKIKRADKLPFDVTIERAIIKVQSVKAEILNDIGYIRISTFDKHTTEGIKKFLSENKNKNKKLRGLILDVRNNPGGLLEEVVSVSDLFLDGGKIVSTRGRTPENTKEFSATKGDMTNGMPIVVLINSGTASAPEILAGALRDNKRAIIIGTRSFGKGSVQKVIPLSEKTAIKLTVAKHFTPSGECIQANGITPDIEADWAEIKKPEALFVVREEFFPNALDAEKKVANKKISDEQNKKAIEALSKKKDEKDKEDEDYELLYRKLSLKERAEKDFQLSKAFDTIITIDKLKAMGASDAKK